MDSNMRNLPEDAALGEQPTVVKGKLYAATKGQQDQLAQFAATLGAPVPEEHRKEDKGYVAPVPPVAAEAMVEAVEPVATVDVVLKVDGVEVGTVTNVEGLEQIGGFQVGEVIMQSAATPALIIDEEAPLSEGAINYLTSGASIEIPVSQEKADEIESAVKALATAEGFTGFEVPDGDYLAMLMLHPPRLPDGTRGEVPQIQIGTTKAAWKGWVKDAIVHGLTQGFVHAEDGTTELTGLSVQVHAPDGQRKRLGFMFSQIAAIIPFREVDELMLRRERANEERKRLADKAKKAKAKARKQQSKSRRNNR